MAQYQNDFLGLQMATLAMMADSAKTIQTYWVQTLESFSSQMPGMVDWKSVDVPVINARYMLNEEQMREAFQIAADLNLNAWTQAANVLSAMPKWAKWPNEVPGRVFTDMFHAMNAQPRRD
ncbi:MAG: hypothetical protein AAFS13_08610 [Pseudomonadota bacterium]